MEERKSQQWRTGGRRGRQAWYLEEGIHFYKKEAKKKRMESETKMVFSRNSKQPGTVGTSGVWRAVISTALRIRAVSHQESFECWANKSLL